MRKRKEINKESKKYDDVVVSARAHVRESDDAVDVVRFVEFFNETLEQHHSNVPRCQFLTDGRVRALRFLCKKYGKRSMISAVHYIAASDFLNGRKTGRCLVSLEWLLKEENFIRVLEDAFRDAPTPDSPEARRERELQQRRAARQQEEAERRQREQQREEWSRRAASIDEIRAILGENCVI